MNTLRIARDNHEDDEADDDDEEEEDAFHLLRHSCCKVVSVLCSLSIHNQTSTHIASCHHGIKSRQVINYWKFMSEARYFVTDICEEPI